MVFQPIHKEHLYTYTAFKVVLHYMSCLYNTTFLFKYARSNNMHYHNIEVPSVYILHFTDIL